MIGGVGFPVACSRVFVTSSKLGVVGSSFFLKPSFSVIPEIVFPAFSKNDGCLGFSTGLDNSMAVCLAFLRFSSSIEL